MLHRARDYRRQLGVHSLVDGQRVSQLQRRYRPGSRLSCSLRSSSSHFAASRCQPAHIHAHICAFDYMILLNLLSSMQIYAVLTWAAAMTMSGTDSVFCSAGSERLLRALRLPIPGPIAAP
jgi:hypothetical protein